MSWWNNRKNEAPSPKMLAAYVDGEFEGCDALLERKLAIEEWLEQNPECIQDIAAWRQLKRIWQATAPEVPPDQSWPPFGIGELQHSSGPPQRSASSSGVKWWWSGVSAASVLALVIGYFWHSHDRKMFVDRSKSPAQAEVNGSRPGNRKFQRRQADHEITELSPNQSIPVASKSDVAILRIDGADTETIVVGHLPVNGPLVLAEPGEVTLTSLAPINEDNVATHFRIEDDPPMIWAPMHHEAEIPK